MRKMSAPTPQLKDYQQYDAMGDFEAVRDVKVEPDYYLHYAFVSLQEAFKNDDYREAMRSYTFRVDHLETLARAFGRIPQDFTERLEEFKKSKEYSGEQDDLLRLFKLARQRVFLIGNVIGDSKAVIQKLRLT